MGSWGSVGDSRWERDRGTYRAVARVWVGLWVGFVEDGGIRRCGGMGVRLWGSDKSDRPSGGRAGGTRTWWGTGTSRGQCAVSIIIMIVSRKKYDYHVSYQNIFYYYQYQSIASGIVSSINRFTFLDLIPSLGGTRRAPP